jgi:hypothetical protein
MGNKLQGFSTVPASPGAATYHFRLLVLITVLAGCATGSAGVGGELEAMKAEQRHKLYRNCVSTQMKTAPIGSGMAVHEACRTWARQRI